MTHPDPLARFAPAADPRAAALLLLVWGALTAACTPGEGPSPPPAVGRRAPDFSGTTLDGAVFDLQGQDGPVLVNLWATWCVPCREETPFLQSIHREYAPQGLTVVGISLDGRSSLGQVSEFVREYGVTYPVVPDPEGVAMDAFHVVGLPASFLLDDGGVIRWMRLGPVSEEDRDFVSSVQEVVE